MDKVVIANRSGMAAKYEPGALASIDAALTRLVAADAARGITTLVVEIDAARQMTAYGVGPIAGGADQRGTKDAVDAVYHALQPAFIMLLDGPDVVPHIALDRVIGINDDDLTIDSDLPYACDAPFDTKVSTYLAVTRVVGRLPMPCGSSKVAPLVALIDHAARHHPKAGGNGTTPFAISAQAWQVSTQLSLNAVLGAGTLLHVCPDAGHSIIDTSLPADVHFINCHGSRADHRFYGQRGNAYPVAMESMLVAPHVTVGTLVAAECCYGAELYDPSLLESPPPICMAYLNSGATAFAGSTTIAYGPAASNGQADLLTQYFLIEALKGGSTGSAMLKARQRFVATQVMAMPSNLKTLAQFVLYGDPSLAVVEATAPMAFAQPVDTGGSDLVKSIGYETERRMAKRVALVSNGKAIAAAATFPGRPVGGPPEAIERIVALSRERGFEGKPLVLSVRGGAAYRAAAHAGPGTRTIAVVTDRKDRDEARPFGTYRIFTAHMLDSKVYAIDICESR